MSVARLTYVFCDGCSESVELDVELDATAATLRANAKEAGWHRAPGGRDICPECWDQGRR